MDFFGAQATTLYDTKMLLKVVFDKTVFVKFLLVITFNKTLMKHISNNQKSIGKSKPAYGFKKSKEKICKPKFSRPFPNVCDFQKENHTL
jgi:hypothetical protein